MPCSVANLPVCWTCYSLCARVCAHRSRFAFLLFTTLFCPRSACTAQASFDDRVKFAEEREALINATAADPLAPEARWWMVRSPLFLSLAVSRVLSFPLKLRPAARTRLLLHSCACPCSPIVTVQDVEAPWQCLATCFELAAAMRSPDPRAFVSSLPVQQDGSCNGLQHYAALGRDVVRGPVCRNGRWSDS